MRKPFPAVRTLLILTALAALPTRAVAADTTRPAAPAVPIIELRGDATALGESHAARLGETIRPVLRDYFTRYFDASRNDGGIDRDSARRIAADFERHMRPEHRDEIRALAAKCGLDPAETLLVQCFPDLTQTTACSTITLPAAASSDKIARFGRNLDFSSLGILNKHSVVLVVHPKDRYAFAAVTWPGIVGVLSGINEHGLTVACMEVARPARKPDAMPYMLLYRTLLEQCKTVSEAVAFLEKTPRQTANNLMLMDASGDRAVAEITPAKVTVRRAPDTAALISTNHHRGTDLDTPGECKRFDYLHDAARRRFGRITEAGVEELLNGAAQGDATLQSMVFEPANRVLYLAVGADAPSRVFARIDLRPHFREDKWEPRIRAFEQADRENPPPRDAALFIGSSSIRGWTNLAQDFPDTKVINRGFGGSSIPDCTRYVDRIVVPYRPRLVILYAGDNDVAAGHTPSQVFEDYREFVRQVRRKLPDVPVAFISIKPSPARLSRLEAMREANDLIRAHIATNSDLMYIDVFTPMLGPDGKPRPELFGPDRLHMNTKGYALWTAVIAPYLKQ